MNKIISPVSKIFLCASSILSCAVISLSQPVTFNYTGAVQTYTVPACVTSIDIEVWGAQGSTGMQGSIVGASGGLGGYTKGRMSSTPGQVLTVYAGGQSGFNGGGLGISGGGNGGGASDVRMSPATLADRIIVGGGGGGGGYSNTGAYGGGGGSGTCGSNYCGGAAGAGPYGAGAMNGGLDGGSGGTAAQYGASGGGGGLNSGGGGGSSSPCNLNGAAGTLGNGGNGGGPTGPGGGGGGYYGGGGASCGSNSNAGAGGGSSWTGTLTNVFFTGGTRTGNGQVIITPVAQGFPPSAPGSINGLSAVCSGDSSVNYSISAVSGATSYTWTAPSGSMITSGQTTTSVTVTFGSASGTISVTANNNCGSSPASAKAITVNANPPANAGNDVTICTGHSATLTASGGTNYLWSTGETTAAVAVAPAVTTTYTVTVGDASGCSGTDSITVTVDSCATGIFFSASNQNSIISPNPTNGEFKIQSFGFKIYSVELYNVMGEKVYTLNHPEQINDEPLTINFSSLPFGIYFVKVFSEKEMFIQKILRR